MIPKSGYRFPACAKPVQPPLLSFTASAGEARSEKIMLKQVRFEVAVMDRWRG
jgi:hypothetical protein